MGDFVNRFIMIIPQIRILVVVSGTSHITKLSCYLYLYAISQILTDYKKSKIFHTCFVLTNLLLSQNKQEILATSFFLVFFTSSSTYFQYLPHSWTLPIIDIQWSNYWEDRKWLNNSLQDIKGSPSLLQGLYSIWQKIYQNLNIYNNSNLINCWKLNFSSPFCIISP